MPLRNLIRPHWQRMQDVRNRKKAIATLGPERRWAEVQSDETEFWEGVLSGRDNRWPEAGLAFRTNAALPFQDHLKELVTSQTVRVLDVGAGPLTTLGKVWPGRDLDITAVDPLAGEYDRLLERLGIVPLCRTSYAIAEELPFSDCTFDLVHAQNSIDHCKDALKALKEMIRVVKPNCYVFLNHAVCEGRREGYARNHQWDLFPKKGKFYVKRPGMAAVDVGKHFSSLVSVTAEVWPHESDYFFVKILRSDDARGSNTNRG